MAKIALDIFLNFSFQECTFVRILEFFGLVFNIILAKSRTEKKVITQGKFDVRIEEFIETMLALSDSSTYTLGSVSQEILSR
jgi:hypothetical protein